MLSSAGGGGDVTPPPGGGGGGDDGEGRGAPPSLLELLACEGLKFIPPSLSFAPFPASCSPPLSPLPPLPQTSFPPPGTPPSPCPCPCACCNFWNSGPGSTAFPCLPLACIAAPTGVPHPGRGRICMLCVLIHLRAAELAGMMSLLGTNKVCG